MPLKTLYTLFLFLLSLAFITPPTFARDWDDLFEHESSVYGKEREEKFPIRAFVVEKESWPGHESLEVFWLYKNTSYPRYNSLRLFPFFYSLESKIDNRYRFISLWHTYRIDGSEVHTSWMYLFYHGTNKSTEHYYHAFFPIYYFSRDGSRDLTHFTPLYYYNSNDFSRHTNILYLADFYRSTDKRRNFVLPLWYYQSTSLSKNLSILPPLFWYWQRQESHGFALLPLVARYNNQNGTGFISPLYLSLVSTQINDESYFSLFLPLYMQYKSPDFNLHINATGLSFSQERILSLPEFQYKDKKLFIDWDVGWFWYLFHVSGRNTFDLNQSDTPTQSVATPKENIPSLQKKPAHNRDTSTSFLGLYTLFGLTAYERADTMRHFRLLPLSWLTWDKQSDDKLQVVAPFYLNYHSKDLSYFVLIPFYGHQYELTPQGKIEKSAWLLTTFVHEKNEFKNHVETSVLWPIFNTYHNEDSAGFRVFPLYWQKYFFAAKTTTSKSILHYAQKTKNSFYIYSLLGYYDTDTFSTVRGVWGFYHQDTRGNGLYHNFWLLPFYYGASLTRASTPSTTYYFHLIPLIFTKTGKTQKNWFFFGYHYIKKEGITFHSLASIISYENVPAYEKTEVGLLAYALHYRYRSDDVYFSLLWHLGAYMSYRPYDFSVGLGLLLGYEKVMRTSSGLLLHHRVLPLWWYTLKDDESYLAVPPAFSYFSHDEKEQGGLQLVGLGLLYYNNYSLKEQQATLLVLGGLLYNYRQHPVRNYRSYGSLFSLLWSYEKEDNYSRFSLLKFLLSCTQNNEQTTWRILGIRI